MIQQNGNKSGLIIGIPKLAEYLECSVNQVYRYLKKGLPGKKIDGSWHFYKSNIERFWEQNTKEISRIDDEEIPLN